VISLVRANVRKNLSPTPLLEERELEEYSED
jgi:hypothetical protein